MSQGFDPRLGERLARNFKGFFRGVGPHAQTRHRLDRGLPSGSPRRSGVVIAPAGPLRRTIRRGRPRASKRDRDPALCGSVPLRKLVLVIVSRIYGSRPPRATALPRATASGATVRQRSDSVPSGAYSAPPSRTKGHEQCAPLMQSPKNHHQNQMGAEDAGRTRVVRPARRRRRRSLAVT